MDYDKALVERYLSQALGRLVEDDAFLLVNEVNERSITHHLAGYLSREFPGYHVDCEFNRMFKNAALVHKAVRRVRQLATVSIWDLDARTAFPDIIVHDRDDDLHNLLVIEAKKFPSDPSEDYRKLNGFMESKDNRGLGYQFSAFIWFNTEDPADSSFEVKESGERWIMR